MGRSHHEVLPLVLFRTQRGLCPCCGAPLKVAAESSAIECEYCGNKAVLERRLRRQEPEVAGAPLRMLSGGPEEGWSLGVAKCAACGAPLEVAADAAAATCGACATECRVELRLRAPEPDPEQRKAMPRRKDERTQAEDQDPKTEHLVWRIVHEQDPVVRLQLARHLEAWTFINPTLARLAPELIAAMRSGDVPLQQEIAEALTKLLCEGKKELRDGVLRAAEPYLMDLQCPRALLFALGLGDGTSLKLLLDAAENACRKGDLEFACAALLGVNWLFQRNFDEHQVMGEILLYRMLYLSGPVLAFALLLAQRQVTGTGFHYQAPVLLRFMDDCAVERPLLLPELDKSFYVGPPEDGDQCRERMALFATLKSPAARRAALRHYLRAPKDASPDLYRQLCHLIVPLLSDPELGEAAAEALHDLTTSPAKTPDAIHELVAQRKDDLPAEVRRAYLQAHPDTKHLDRKQLPYWQSKPSPSLSPEMKQALDQWREGLGRAVDVNKDQRAAWTKAKQKAGDKLPEIFDPRSLPPAAKTASTSARTRQPEADEAEFPEPMPKVEFPYSEAQIEQMSMGNAAIRAQLLQARQQMAALEAQLRRDWEARRQEWLKEQRGG